MTHLNSKMEKIEVQWLHDKYANFVKGKVYESKASGLRKDGTYTYFSIEDEDGDRYSLDAERVGKDFIIIGGMG